MSRVEQPPYLQHPFLNRLRREGLRVSVFLHNGLCLDGTVEAFDQYAIFLKDEASHVVHAVYKHAVASVMPTAVAQFSIAKADRLRDKWRSGEAAPARKAVVVTYRGSRPRPMPSCAEAEPRTRGLSSVMDKAG